MARPRSRSKSNSRDATGPVPIEVVQPREGGEPADSRTISEISEAESGARIAKYWRWIKQALEIQQPFQAAYTESMQILANDPLGHWTAAALAELAKDKRPPLIINHTTATVMTVCGLQRRNREIAKFLPRDPDDAEAVELLDYLFRWQYDLLGLKETDSDVFLKKYAGGLGFWKLYYDTAEDPRGVIACDPVSARNVLWDPNYPDCKWSDAEYVIHAEWRTVDGAIDDWPEYETEIRHTTGEWIRHQQGPEGSNLGDTRASERFFWDPQTQRVRIAQVWYKRVKTAKIALWKDGSVEDDADKVAAIESEIKGDPESDRAVQIVRHPVTTVYMAHMLDEIELSHDPSSLPFKALPFVPAKGYHFWKMFVGAVQYMKDPQREKNKRRSVITDIAGRATHDGHWAEAGSVDQKQYEDWSAGAKVLLEYAQGSKAPIKIEPPTLPQYLVYLEQQATEDIPRSVNVTPELMGIPKAQVVSGRAVSARQASGQLSQEWFMDTFASEQGEVAKLIVEMIKDSYTIEEARRVLGALARRNQDEQLAQRIEETEPDALDQLLSQAFKAKFDVIVTTQPWDPSGKSAALRTLLDLFAIVPAPPDLVVELATEGGAIPKSIGTKWMARLQAAQQAQAEAAAAAAGVPPGAGGPAGEQPPPPEVVAALAGGGPRA